MTSTFPDLPWQRVATDLFEWKKNYFLIVDYYSRFIEVARLKWTTAEEVIQHMKSIFARHGIPKDVISDNSPQYSGEAYKQFAQEYWFRHITSSPYYPQSNGEAEWAVGTIKHLLNKEKDPYLAILSYRSTPLQNGYSPSELLMNRKLRTMVPITRERKQKSPRSEISASTGGRNKEQPEKEFWYLTRSQRPTRVEGRSTSLDSWSTNRSSRTGASCTPVLHSIHSWWNSETKYERFGANAREQSE